MKQPSGKARPRIVISAPHRSSGKSTISIGLCAALQKSGLVVQTFKKGPDYIDPMWLSAASGRECINLDFFMMGEDRILSAFGTATEGGEIAIVEGNMGFFDGLDPEGRDSTAALSRLLGAPAILVVNARRMTRGVAPLILGHLQFEPDTNIAGVILNRIRGVRHEKKLKEALARYCNIEVVGAIPDQKELFIRERHLGLTPIKEDAGLSPVIDNLADTVAAYVDLGRIRKIAESAPSIAVAAESPPIVRSPEVRIGLAADQAFTFYYPESLRALREAGAELVPFHSMTDKRLPSVQALYIGGGFPEIFMDELERNGSLRTEIREQIEDGLPVYAECGGLMYLARSISYDGKKRSMVGVLPCDVEMHRRPMGHGYVTLSPTGESPWGSAGGVIRGHEFHHSKVVNLGKVEFAYKMARGFGVDGEHDGICYRNVLASYAHLHIASVQSWAESFVAFVRRRAFKAR
jgi:cobyrinic acid a,c-diamide synthase